MNDCRMTGADREAGAQSPEQALRECVENTDKEWFATMSVYYDAQNMANHISAKTVEDRGDDDKLNACWDQAELAVLKLAAQPGDRGWKVREKLSLYRAYRSVGNDIVASILLGSIEHDLGGW